METPIWLLVNYAICILHIHSTYVIHVWHILVYNILVYHRTIVFS